MPVFRAVCCVFALVLSAPVSAQDACRIRPVETRCEGIRNPLAVVTHRPRLRWQLEAVRPDVRGERQTAYRVLAATAPDLLKEGRADLWDSGRVTSSEALNIEYAGKAAGAVRRVWWAVRVWDTRGNPSAWSQPTWWEVGPTPDLWKRSLWIVANRQLAPTEEEFFRDRPSPLLRREFTVKKGLRRARAYVAAAGFCEFRLNGRKVGEDVLAPGWTDYRKRVFYTPYDVTPLLKPGANAAGILLGNGWRNPLPLKMWGHLNLREHLSVGHPAANVMLVLDYADGKREVVGSNMLWKWAEGPILRDSVYLGEVYDARRELLGWDQPGFNARLWPSVTLAPEYSNASLPNPEPLPMPSVRVTETIRAIKVTEPKPGVYLFDMGQNFAGRVRLRMRGAAGTRITLRYGELLYPDGTLNPMTSVTGQIKNRQVPPGSEYPSTAWQSDTYVCKGEGEEVWSPRFTFHGFRYVEATGLSERPPITLVTGERMHTDVESVGEFACANPLLNQIQRMVRRTLVSNLFSVQSDCPHREKFGYGGDIVATSDMALYNFDMAAFYTKTVRDFADAVRPNGGFTETAPFVGISDAGLGGGSGPVGWGTAHPLLVWQLYQWNGDRRLLAEQYSLVKRWLALLERSSNGLILDNGISDHESLVPKPRALTGTAFFYLNARLLANMANVLGKKADESRYATLAADIRNAFNRRFLREGKYDSGTQACQSFALSLGLVPQDARQSALNVLIRDVMEEHKGHLTTGIFGTKYLLDALTANGRGDVAYGVATQPDFPGWGWMLKNGATTLWEHWEFSDNTFSHNHPMFGSVSEWFFRGLAGIQPALDASGFDRIVIRPSPQKGLEWARATYRSVRGPVRSAWRWRQNRLTLEISVPVGATAKVYVPGVQGERVTESGKPAERARGVTFLQNEAGACVYRVGSGSYRFEVR